MDIVHVVTFVLDVKSGEAIKTGRLSKWKEAFLGWDEKKAQSEKSFEWIDDDVRACALQRCFVPALLSLYNCQHAIWKGNDLMSDIHEQLRALLDKEGATYRVVEHEPEGRTEMIAKIRGNRIEQSIKSIVVQVRLNRKENIYCLANVPGDCRIDFDGIKAHF